MVKEAEQFKQEDDVVRRRIEAKNEFERYAYSVRESAEREDLKDKLDEEDKTKIKEAVDASLKWLEENGQEATADECEAKQKELEAVVNPVMIKMYSQAAPPEEAASGGTSASGSADGNSKFSEGP